MSEPDPKDYDVMNYETWSTEALLNHASWLYDQDRAGEDDNYDELAKIAAILNDREQS
jgi:hypothetical protein